MTVHRRCILLAVVTMGAAACSDAPTDPNVATDACGGACPAELCIAGQCIDGGDDVGPDTADVGPDTDTGCLPGECPDGQYCEPAAGDTPAMCLPGCDSDDQCVGVLVCLDHECVRPCTEDTMCDRTEYCAAGACALGCRTGGDCGSGLSCLEVDTDDGLRQRCVPTPCASRSECPEGFACVDEQCEVGCADGECGEDVCDPDLLQCVPPCAADDVCDDDEYCNTDSGQCLDGCREGGCALGFVCESGACNPGPCENVTDCADDHFCGPDGVCAPGCRADGACTLTEICVEGACIEGCRADTACADVRFCDLSEGDHGTCRRGCRVGGCELPLLCDTVSRQCVDRDCVEDVECGDGVICVDGGCIAGCRDDQECGEQQVCHANECQTGCHSDPSCASDEYCTAADPETLGQCETGCRQGGCPLGLVCDLEARQCVDEPCVADVQCPLEAVCEDGDCVPGCHGTDARCPELFVCDTDVCVPGCRGDGDCDDDEICDAVDRVCVPGCQTDDQCLGIDVCRVGECVTPRCVSDIECPDTGYCTDEYECALGCRSDGSCGEGEICEGRICRAGCRDDDECTEGDYCAPGAFVCAPGCRVEGCPDDLECDPETRECEAASCTSNHECTIGQYCQAQTQTCTSGCRDDRDCGGGELCLDHQCLEGCRGDEECPVDTYCARAPEGTCEVGCRPFACPQGQQCDLDTRECARAIAPNCEANNECAPTEVCDPERRVCRPGCQDDRICVNGEVCPGKVIDPALVCRPGCRTDDQCPAGQACEPGTLTCIDGCADDDACGFGAECMSEEVGDQVFRSCVPTPCGDDRECDDGQYCNLGTEQCTDGCRLRQCPDAQVCDARTRACQPQTCRADADCESPQSKCERGVCRPSCSDDAHCATDEICSETRRECVVGCRGDDDCPTVGYCAIDQPGADGLCRFGCREGGCEGDEACDTRTHVCSPRVCDADSDCADEEYCRAGVECAGGCRSDAQCGDGMVCGDEGRTCLVGCRGADDGDTICTDVDEISLTIGEPLLLDQAAICLGDRDHVRVAMGPSERLTVALAFGDGDGALGLQIQDGCGGGVLATGRADGDGLVAEALAPPSGSLVVRVIGLGVDATRAYTLTLGRGAAECRQDEVDGAVAEPNDDVGTATLLDVPRDTVVALDGLQICADDEDWYAVQVVAPGARLAVHLSQSAHDGPLHIEIRNAAREVLALTEMEGATKVAATQLLDEAGVYYVRIFPAEPVGDGIGTAYRLRLFVSAAPCIPDTFEPNDGPADAPLISGGAHAATMCGTQDDIDWYRIQLLPGDAFNIALSYDHDLIGNLSELPAVLYGPGGRNDLRDFLVRDGVEHRDVLFDGADGFVVEAAGQWLLGVESGGLQANVDYLVEVTVAAPACEDDDEPVPNESCDAALPLVDQVQGTVCGPTQDEDWFGFVVDTVGRDITVQLDHFHFDGNLELEVYSPGGNDLLGFSYNSGPNLETVNFRPRMAGRHCVRVFTRSAQVQNRYTLRLTQ